MSNFWDNLKSKAENLTEISKTKLTQIKQASNNLTTQLSNTLNNTTNFELQAVVNLSALKEKTDYSIFECFTVKFNTFSNDIIPLSKIYLIITESNFYFLLPYNNLLNNFNYFYGKVENIFPLDSLARLSTKSTNAQHPQSGSHLNMTLLNIEFVDGNIVQLSSSLTKRIVSEFKLRMKNIGHEGTSKKKTISPHEARGQKVRFLLAKFNKFMKLYTLAVAGLIEAGQLTREVAKLREADQDLEGEALRLKVLEQLRLKNIKNVLVLKKNLNLNNSFLLNNKNLTEKEDLLSFINNFLSQPDVRELIDSHEDFLFTPLTKAEAPAASLSLEGQDETTNEDEPKDIDFEEDYEEEDENGNLIESLYNHSESQQKEEPVADLLDSSSFPSASISSGITMFDEDDLLDLEDTPTKSSAFDTSDLVLPLEEPAAESFSKVEDQSIDDIFNEFIGSPVASTSAASTSTSITSSLPATINIPKDPFDFEDSDNDQDTQPKTSNTTSDVNDLNSMLESIESDFSSIMDGFSSMEAFSSPLPSTASASASALSTPFNLEDFEKELNFDEFLS